MEKLQIDLEVSCSPSVNVMYALLGSPLVVRTVLFWLGFVGSTHLVLSFYRPHNETSEAQT